MKQHPITMRRICLLREAIVSFVLVFVIVDATATECVSINTVLLCQNIVYNSTLLPNKFGLTSTRSISLEINKYIFFIRQNCSDELKFLLCATLAPMCLSNSAAAIAPLPVGPCKEMCLRVQKDCENTFNEWGYPWPAPLRCDYLPFQHDDKNCFSTPSLRSHSPNLLTTISHLEETVTTETTKQDMLKPTATPSGRVGQYETNCYFLQCLPMFYTLQIFASLL